MALRMVELVIPSDGSDDLSSLPEDLKVIGRWREPLSENQVLLRVLVRGDKTEAVIHELEARYQSRSGFRLCIFEVQATVPPPEPDAPPPADEATSKPKEEKKVDPQRIACAELVQKLSAGADINRIYLLTVVLSTIVAAIGLMRNNVAVIIGAMVIAPLLGPNMTLALATTLGDAKLARRALRVNAAGLLLALGLSALIGVVFTVDPRVQEIEVRTHVSLSDVALALAAGSAGALAFTTGLSQAVVGVMVAVALLPPLATVGLLLGAGQWRLAGTALLLLAANIICVNLAGVATFLMQSVRPRHYWEAQRARRIVLAAAACWIALLALLIAVMTLAQWQ